jgi:S-adenosylmethionine:tRNA ribosyltransferase-isomerase
MKPWFDLPRELEAAAPPEARGLRRDDVRLMVTFREKDGVAHARFRDLPAFLRAGDLLVVNDSATLPAAVTARRVDGEEISLHFSTRLHETHWAVEPRRTQVTKGERLGLPAGGAATLLTPYRDSQRLWIARLELPESVEVYLQHHGRPIAYDYVRDAWPIDAYQTIFARVRGSAEMPSAGRPFTPEVVGALERKGIRIAAITLHTGVASLEGDESPYPEWFEVPAQTAEAVRATLRDGGRVIAVGTTVVRALESAVDESGQIRAASGWTDVVITPERGVRVVDGLLTGFHEPAASHLRMLEAIAGRAHIRRAYRAALAGGYFWHEFGDVHLIL